MECPSCGGNGKTLYSDLQDRLYSAGGTWELWRCTRCKFVWIDPLPTPEQLPELYKGYYTHQKPQLPQQHATAIAHSLLKENGLVQRAIDMVIAIGLLPIARLPSQWQRAWFSPEQRGRILDIGCGNGNFLNAMRSFGWETYGVEPDRTAVHVAREQLGLQVEHGSLEDANLPENSFDVVTMNHVIEHLPNPQHTLQECYRVLQPGGRLVLFTPNINSLSHWLLRRNWLHLDPPRHLFLFSAAALRTEVERAGFRVELLNTSASGANFSWCASRLIKRWSRLPTGWRSRVPHLIRLEASFFGLFENLIRPFFNVGEELALVAIREIA